MTGDINFFRKRFLGGFNKQDVIDYVTKLARERNDLKEAKDKAENEAASHADLIVTLRSETEEAKTAKIQAESREKELSDEIALLRAEAIEEREKAESKIRTLTAELQILRSESEAAKQLINESLERQSLIFQTAGIVFEEFETLFNEIQAGIKKRAENTIAELKQTVDAVEKIPLSLANTKERIAELGATLQREGAEED